MADFRCVTQTICDIQEELREVHNTLFDALKQVKNVQETLDDPNNWQGEAQLVGAAFLKLVVMYHGELSTEDGHFDPILEAINTLQEYLEHDSDFYNEWENYKKLSDI